MVSLIGGLAAGWHLSIPGGLRRQARLGLLDILLAALLEDGQQAGNVLAGPDDPVGVFEFLGNGLGAQVEQVPAETLEFVVELVAFHGTDFFELHG
jgi:hypothetical protein